MSAFFPRYRCNSSRWERPPRQRCVVMLLSIRRKARAVIRAAHAPRHDDGVAVFAGQSHQFLHAGHPMAGCPRQGAHDQGQWQGASKVSRGGGMICLGFQNRVEEMFSPRIGLGCTGTDKPMPHTLPGVLPRHPSQAWWMPLSDRPSKPQRAEAGTMRDLSFRGAAQPRCCGTRRTYA